MRGSISRILPPGLHDLSLIKQNDLLEQGTKRRKVGICLLFALWRGSFIVVRILHVTKPPSFSAAK